MVTVVKTGALLTPRLSVTTREKVTVPDVFGTVTETLEVGAVVVTLGLLGESGVEFVTGVGTGIGIGMGVGIGMGLTMGVTGSIGPVTASGLLLGLFGICVLLRWDWIPVLRLH